ncbi:MAG: putative YggU family [archaeon]
MLITVTVRASSGKEEIFLLDDGSYRVLLKAPAEEGKANLALLKLLQKYFKKHGEKNCHIKIIKGMTSKNKIIEVS